MKLFTAAVALCAVASGADARALLQGTNTQQSIAQMAAIGQAEHWAPWHPGTPWGTTKVLNGKVVQTSEEAAAQEAADAATMTPDQQQKFEQTMQQEEQQQQQTQAQINAVEANEPVIQP